MTNQYRYETHMHTSEASACASNTAIEMVEKFHQLGYSGIMVTNHFFNGNSSIPRELSWEEKINLFCKPYELALEHGIKIGIDVFFGLEYGYNGADFLTYGLDKSFLLAHPDLCNISIYDYFKLVHENGGFIIHAHPFRQAVYIGSIQLFPDLVDGIEVINTSHFNENYNIRATYYADSYELPKTSGSDAHRIDGIFGGGMLFDHKLENLQDYYNTLKNKTGYKLLDKNE